MAKRKWNPLTAEEFWSLREGMTVYVLVAPDEMVERIFKCGHSSGRRLSFATAKPYAGSLLRKGRPDRQTTSDRLLRLVGKILQAEAKETLIKAKADFCQSAGAQKAEQ
jgi:hypothetical protein